MWSETESESHDDELLRDEIVTVGVLEADVPVIVGVALQVYLDSWHLWHLEQRIARISDWLPGCRHQDTPREEIRHAIFPIHPASNRFREGSKEGIGD